MLFVISIPIGIVNDIVTFCNQKSSSENEQSVNYYLRFQLSIDFPLRGCYTATWHLEKQEYSLYLKDYDLNAHTGHFLWWTGSYRDPSFAFKDVIGEPRIWKLNDRPIWYSFGKAGHDHTADVRAAKKLKYGAERLGQERGWGERQNERMSHHFQRNMYHDRY